MSTLNRDVYAQPGTVPGERSDCAVRALMVAACVDYATAHAACKAAGRRDRDSMAAHDYDAAIRALVPGTAPYERARSIPSAPGASWVQRCQTLADWLRDHPAGHFIVWVTGHYIAVIDGVVHDWGRWKRTARRAPGQVGAAGDYVRTIGGRRRVVGAWRLV